MDISFHTAVQHSILILICALQRKKKMAEWICRCLSSHFFIIDVFQYCRKWMSSLIWKSGSPSLKILFCLLLVQVVKYIVQHQIIAVLVLRLKKKIKCLHTNKQNKIILFVLVIHWNEIELKGTQAWEFCWLRFWILYFFIVR